MWRTFGQYPLESAQALPSERVREADLEDQGVLAFGLKFQIRGPNKGRGLGTISRYSVSTIQAYSRIKV